MTFFRIQLVLSGKVETILGVLSYTGDVYFWVEDINRFVRKGVLLKCRPVEEIAFTFNLPKNLLVMKLENVLDALEYSKTARSRYLSNFLEYGHVRDLPFDYPCHVITSCEDTEGMQFVSWLNIFFRDYGPYKLKRPHNVSF